MKLRHKQYSVLVPVAVISLISISDAQAVCNTVSGNYSISLAVNDTANCVRSVSATTAQNFFDLVKSSGLQSLSSQYTGSEAAFVSAVFNSLPMSLSFPTAGSTTLNFSIPAFGIDQTFNGATRQDSGTQFENYLKKQNNILGRILQYQAANSPASPISGPGGMIQSVTASDFDANFTNSATNIAAPQGRAAAENKKASNLAGIALQYGSVSTQGNKINTTTLPLSYTIRNDIDPRRQLIFSLPITQIDTNGAKSYEGGFGVAYRLPMNDNWTLTPAAKYSIVGSVDMATVASLYSASITSTYVWNRENYDIAMGNMIGFLRTGSFKAGDYNVDPGISNTAFRNGLMLSQPVTLGGSRMSLEYSVIDTRYTGSKMYVDGTDEIGVTLGTNKNAFSARSYLRGGITYITGKSTNGFTVNLGYWF